MMTGVSCWRLRRTRRPFTGRETNRATENGTHSEENWVVMATLFVLPGQGLSRILFIAALVLVQGNALGTPCLIPSQDMDNLLRITGTFYCFGPGKVGFSIFL